MIYVLSPRRRRVARSNLAHAFPDRDARWQRQIALTSLIRLIETGLLSLASPFINPVRLRQIARPGKGLEEMLAARTNGHRATVLASIHLAYWECQTWMGLLSSSPIGNFGVIYRPLDDPQADAFVRQTRERFGMRLLSRKEGFAQALKILRAQGCVGLLFDQNAGLQGALTTLFGRVCSSTELPGILAEKFHAEVRVIYPVRLDFWRVELRIDTLDHQGTCEDVTVGLNRWQEALLTTHEDLCASWLWSHDRWRNQDMPASRLRLQSKRDFLPHESRARSWVHLPRKTHIVIRLPNWLGDVVMTLPLLRQLRESRPDAAITLVGKAQFKGLIEQLGLPYEHYVPLARRGFNDWRQFIRLRQNYPDVYLLFTHSIRGDVEAWLSGCRQRFGIRRPQHPRPLLSHSYRRPSDWNATTQHQFSEWTRFMEAFGLRGPIDCTPLSASHRLLHSPPCVGLIVGSENLPAKRWPVARWRELVQAFPNQHFVVFGTPGDRVIADEVCRGFGGDRIENLAGKTTLAQFIDRLAGCDFLVANDTGGMHLANALGIPVIALFGPTNPLRTAPVFSAPVIVLQPPGCLPTGGSPLEQLDANTVVERLQREIAALATRD
jgi:heptosyltransferase-2